MGYAKRLVKTRMNAELAPKPAVVTGGMDLYSGSDSWGCVKTYRTAIVSTGPKCYAGLYYLMKSFCAHKKTVDTCSHNLC